MNKYPELYSAMEEMALQDALYRPGSFWENASTEIVKELENSGMENFRLLETALGFFVPTYGLPGNCFTPEITNGLLDHLKNNFPGALKPALSLEQFLSGRSAALADYRVLLAGDIPGALPHLQRFSESSFGNPIEQFEFDGKKFSRSSLNYLLGLTMLKKHLHGEIPKTVLEIGGGFGTLGEVMLSSGIEGIRYIDIDIPPVSFVAQEYLISLLGNDKVSTYRKTKDKSVIEIDRLPECSVLCSWQIEKLQGRADLFVNFISFQEMEPDIVQNYLYHVSRLETKWILLRNIREGKNVRRHEDEAGVRIPVFGDDYAKMLPGYELVERNVIPYGFRTVDNFNSELFLFRRK
jgi:putative sugar O-methyltransferase